MKRVNTSDRILETIQSNVAESVNRLEVSPLLNAAYVDGYVSPGDNIIKHSLGRACKNFECVFKDNFVDLCLSTTVNNAPTFQLILKANAFANIRLRLT